MCEEVANAENHFISNLHPGVCDHELEDERHMSEKHHNYEYGDVGKECDEMVSAQGEEESIEMWWK
jgi:hypothetical protein